MTAPVSARAGMPFADEGRLLARVVGGDAVAFRTLVDRHLPLARAVAHRMLGDASEAEDTAQEAFLRLWTHGGRIVIGDGGLRPWLRRVVSNAAIDRIRRRRGTDVTDQLPERSIAADQQAGIERQELSARVAGALAQLPERQRQALVLFHYEGSSQSEIAAIMEISEDAVESLLARARRALKASLVGEWRQLLPDIQPEAEGGVP